MKRRRIRTLTWITTALFVLAVGAWIVSIRWAIWCRVDATFFYLGCGSIAYESYHRGPLRLQVLALPRWKCTDYGWSKGSEQMDIRPRFHSYEGLGQLRVSLPLPILWFVVCVVMIFLWDRDLRRRSPPGQCRQCGYDLTANTTGVCPECGKPVAQQAEPK